MGKIGLGAYEEFVLTYIEWDRSVDLITKRPLPAKNACLGLSLNYLAVDHLPSWLSGFSGLAL